MPLAQLKKWHPLLLKPVLSRLGQGPWRPWAPPSPCPDCSGPSRTRPGGHVGEGVRDGRQGRLRGRSRGYPCQGTQSHWAGDTEALTGSFAHRFSQTALHLQEWD